MAVPDANQAFFKTRGVVLVPEDPRQRESLEALDANLEVLDAATAQATEYWLAVSSFSLWTRPAKKLPWNADVFRADVEAYGRRGLRHVTSFADFIDAEYVRLHGDPPLEAYGGTLLEWRPGGGSRFGTGSRRRFCLTVSATSRRMHNSSRSPGDRGVPVRRGWMPRTLMSRKLVGSNPSIHLGNT
jgi:hypothetical protein